MKIGRATIKVRKRHGEGIVDITPAAGDAIRIFVPSDGRLSFKKKTDRHVNTKTKNTEMK